jgi:hypothetical protein
MAADPSSINSALKETWTEERIAEQLYQDNPILSRAKKLKNTQMGEYALTPIHVGRNWGWSATSSSGGTLNSAGQQGYAQAQWAYTNQHTQIKLQGSAIDQTKGDALSVANVVDEEISGAVNDLNRNISRQIFSDGSGQIAQCGTTSSSTTITLNATSGANALERGWIGVGAVIDIGTTASSATIAAGVTITAVDVANATITVSGSAVSTTSSHYVSLQGARTTAPASLEMNGLHNIVSTSATLGGITTAATPAWAAANADSTSQALTLALLYTQNQKVAQNTGTPADFVVTGLKQQRVAYTLAQAQVRFASDSNLTVGSVEGVNINGVKLYGLPDCKNEDIFFLTIGDLISISAGDPYWQSKVTGGENLVWVQGEDAYAGKLTVRMQLGCRRRNSHAKLSGLT